MEEANANEALSSVLSFALSQPEASLLIWIGQSSSHNISVFQRSLSSCDLDGEREKGHDGLGSNGSNATRPVWSG